MEIHIGFEIVTSYLAFNELRQQWNGLADKLENPLLRHEWFLCCAKAFHRDGSLRVCIVRSDGELVAAAPLASVRSLGVERWEFIGVSTLYEPCGFLFDSLGSLNNLVEGIINQGKPLILQRLETGSPVIRAIRKIPISRAISHFRVTKPTLSVRLPNDWKYHLSGRSANFRYDLKRKFRRAKAKGKVSAKCITIKPESLYKWFKKLIEVEGSGWKGVRGSSLLHNKALGLFFKEYSKLAAEEKMLKISLLQIDGKVISAQLVIEAYKRLWVLKMGYDETYSRISPGFLLTAETVRAAIERNIEAYEFLGSSEPWEERWGTKSRPYSLVMIYPATIMGALALLKDGLIVFRQRLSKFL